MQYKHTQYKTNHKFHIWLFYLYFSWDKCLTGILYRAIFHLVLTIYCDIFYKKEGLKMCLFVSKTIGFIFSVRTAVSIILFLKKNMFEHLKIINFNIKSLSTYLFKKIILGRYWKCRKQWSPIKLGKLSNLKINSFKFDPVMRPNRGVMN